MNIVKRKKLRTVLLVFIGLLIGARLYLPIFVKNYLNDYLGNKISGYTGYIEDVDISLIRGAYSLEDFTFKKKEGKKQSPFIDIDKIDISLSWKALFRRRILMDLSITKPRILFVDSAKKADQQLGKGSSLDDWQDIYTKIIPVKLESLKIRKGEVLFTNNETKVPVDVHLKKIKVDATNINNSKKQNQSLVSKFKVSAEAQDHAPLSLSGGFNIVSKPLMFDLNGKLENFELVKINNFLKSYGPFDLTSGTFNFYTELASKKNKVVGYVKPSFDKVDVLDGKEGFDSFRELGFEFGSAILNLFFRNGKTISVASKIPVQGDLTKPQFGLWEGFKVALDNAWGKPSVDKKIDNEISIKDVKIDKKKKK